MTAASDYGTLLTTLPDRAEAARVADLLVAERLAACVQMLPIDSVYRWEGAVRREAETLLLIKTRSALFERATARIRQVHPYTVPEIVGMPFAAGLPAYLAWIADNTLP
jgi:periplasmic divalent cation tolerance protein